MEVKPGYKQTEVGVIPEGWEVKLLPEVCRFRGGKAHEQYISDLGQFICVNSKFISSDGEVRKYSTANFCSAKRNDVLMVMSDLPNGKALAKGFLVDQDDLYAVNQRVCALTAYKDCPRYLFYVLNRNPYFLKFDDGVSQTHLLNHVFQKCPIPLPPTKAEQEAIAGALSDADALIESLGQLVAKKRQIKHGAMQQLLTGQKRLPGFTGEWETKRLGEIGEALIGLTYKPTDVREHGVLVLRSSNVYEGRLRFEDNVFVEMAIPEKIMVKPGDILICVRNGSRDLIGKCAKIDERATGMTFGAFMAVFRTPFHDFIYYQFQSDAMHRQIHEHLGATINQITNRSLNSFQVPLPPDEMEQQAIVNVLADMDAEIIELEAKLAKARQVKQGMMQELLTGRIRLVSTRREGSP